MKVGREAVRQRERGREANKTGTGWRFAKAAWQRCHRKLGERAHGNVYFGREMLKSGEGVADV